MKPGRAYKALHCDEMCIYLQLDMHVTQSNLSIIEVILHCGVSLSKQQTTSFQLS